MVFTVYQLALENNKHYFGTTPTWRKETRLSEHRDGGGSKWTALYPPVEHNPVVRTWTFGYGKKKEAYAFENQKVEEFLNLYGIDSCRGGVNNYGKPGGYRWWVRTRLRHLVPADYDWNS